MKTISTPYSARKIPFLDIILGTQWQVRLFVPVVSFTQLYSLASLLPIISLPPYYWHTYVENILQRQSAFSSTKLTICTQTACDAQVLMLLFCVSVINPLWAGNATCAVYGTTVQNCCVILLHWSIVFGNHWVHWAVTMHFFLRMHNKYGGLRKMQAYP